MKNILLLLLTIVLASCSSKLNYLGDTYPSTKDIDVYFDEKEIDKEYIVIGKLTNNYGHNEAMFDLETIKSEMIKTAKRKGANAILFSYYNKFYGKTKVRSKLIRYKDSL